MPDSGQRPHDKQVEHQTAPGSHSAPAQRKIHVVPKPRPQRDVPPAPEFGYGFRDIGIIEVLGEFEPEHPPQANGHVRVAREIVVNLQGVRDETEPEKHRRCVSHTLKRPIGNETAGIGEKHLLAKPNDEALYARRKLPPALFPVFDLVGKGGVAHNGPRQQAAGKRRCRRRRSKRFGGPVRHDRHR